MWMQFIIQLQLEVDPMTILLLRHLKENHKILQVRSILELF